MGGICLAVPQLPMAKSKGNYATHFGGFKSLNETTRDDPGFVPKGQQDSTRGFQLWEHAQMIRNRLERAEDLDEESVILFDERCTLVPSSLAPFLGAPACGMLPSQVETLG
jgi:hypothetical protein